jgi:chromosome partitioning protein
MRVLAFVNQKGGAGKTTLAASCGVHAVECGLRVRLIEMDDQRSLAAWSAERRKIGAADPGVDTIDSVGGLRSTLDGAAAAGFDVAILDTKGEDSALTNAAIAAADFCIVPTRPHGIDLKASLPTVQRILGARKAFGFVLNQTPTHSKRVSNTQAALATLGVGASTVVVNRLDHADAVSAGYGITEYRPDGPAARELRSFWAWMEPHLALEPGNTLARAA